MPTRASLMVLLVLSGTLGCAPEIQRAALTPAFPDVKREASEPMGAREHKLVFRSPSARVHVFSNDALNGDHHLFFSPIRGTYLVSGTSGHARLHMEIGMRALRAESGWITAFAGRMLDVSGHPRTIVDARVEPIDGQPHQRLVTGNVTLRGVQHGIRFRADVTEERDGVRFRASFDMSRGAFGIRAGPGEGDVLIRDDFTVTIDLHATPEHVKIEQVEDSPDTPGIDDPIDDDEPSTDPRSRRPQTREWRDSLPR